MPARQTVLAVLTLALTPAALADDGERLAAGCAACHGVARPLAGMRHDDFVATMRAFRDGGRADTVMPQLARGYSEGEVAAMARWFAAQPPPR
ncbi:MAG TPA: cytochrome C [Casimicrobiaceae bacterium]|jgi:cytochrome c553